MNLFKKIILWFNDCIECPDCKKIITWNDGWNKWDNCNNCGFNPNYDLPKKKMEE
mgnify:CR=1 FL=1